MIDLTYNNLKQIIMKHLCSGSLTENASNTSYNKDLLKKWKIGNDKYVYRRINVNSLVNDDKNQYKLNKNEFLFFINNNLKYGIKNGISANVDSFVKIPNDKIDTYSKFCYDLLNIVTDSNQDKLEKLLVDFSINIIDNLNFDLLNNILGIEYEYKDLIHCFDENTVVIVKFKVEYLESIKLSVLYNPSDKLKNHCLILPNKIVAEIIMNRLCEIDKLINNFDKNINNIVGKLRKIWNTIKINNNKLNSIINKILTIDVCNDINRQLNAPCLQSNYTNTQNGHYAILSLKKYSEFVDIISDLHKDVLTIIDKDVKKNIDFNYKVTYDGNNYIIERVSGGKLIENHFNSFKDFLKYKDFDSIK